MDEARYPKKYLNMKCEGRRPVDRPRLRWMADVKEAITRRGTTLDDIIEEETLLNRWTWKNLVWQSD